jgi:23S rRNA (adenine2503-C2)-methyltransferase
MLHAWMWMKNRVYHGNAGLQLSINSTDEAERRQIFSGNALTLLEIARMTEGMVPVGRKIVLNFPVCDWTINAQELRKYFEPERFIVKLTPMHETATAKRFGHETHGDYVDPRPYRAVAAELRAEGFEVLIFIASRDEDHGMITCGNAVLASRKTGKVPRARATPLNFIGGSPIGKTPFMPWRNQPDAYHTDLVETNVQLG